MFRRLGAGGVLGAAIALLLTACQSSGEPAVLQASAQPPASSCPKAQGYQHGTLDYRLCYPSGWSVRDYTAEPGAGGALSVVAFGPGLPGHPSAAEFMPPIEVRVLADSRASIESEFSQQTPRQLTRVAGQEADQVVIDDGPAAGTVVVLVEYQGRTYLLERAPSSHYQTPFERLLQSFAFAAPNS